MSVKSSSQTTKNSEPDQLGFAGPPTSETSEESVLAAVRPKVTLKGRKTQKLRHVLNRGTAVKKRYLTFAEKVNPENARDLKNEPSPFSYPKDLEAFAHGVLNKAWRNDVRVKELTNKCFNRLSYKEKQKQDLLNRLYVKEPTSEPMQTMMDLDPNYYENVQGKIL